MSYDIKCPGYGGYHGGWQCNWKGEFEYTSDVSEYHYQTYCRKDNKDYCYGPGYGDCEYFRRHYGISYITTAICDTLGLEKNNLFLHIIDAFRYKLEQDTKMFKQLEIYDIVGPIIANKINGDKKIALELFNSTIIPVCNDITKCDYRTAIIKYTNMTKNLIEKYKDSVSIGLDVFKMSEKIGEVKYGSQYKKSLNFGVPFRR